MYIHVLMRDEKEDQTNNKAKQHSTPKAVTFPKKNESIWFYSCSAQHYWQKNYTCAVATTVCGTYAHVYYIYTPYNYNLYCCAVEQ